MSACGGDNGNGNDMLTDYTARLEALAIELGMNFYPVSFDLVPDGFMVEIAVYRLPVRMRHWSFGARYLHQLVRQHMGHSKIFKVMFPGDPCHAFMLEQNSLAENTLVTAHVLGHADFAKNNALFTCFIAIDGSNILEQSAARAQRLERALAAHGQERVEAVLDAALALEIHIDVDQPLQRALRRIRRLETGAAAGSVWRQLRAPAGRRPCAGQRSIALECTCEHTCKRTPRRAAARALAAAAGNGPVVVFGPVRSRDGRLGARHLVGGARGNLLFSSDSRLSDHERRLGLLLACGAARRAGGAGGAL